MRHPGGMDAFTLIVVGALCLVIGTGGGWITGVSRAAERLSLIHI